MSAMLEVKTYTVPVNILVNGANRAGKSTTMRTIAGLCIRPAISFMGRTSRTSASKRSGRGEP